MARTLPDEPVFNLNNLDSEELGHLEYIVNSPSWIKVFRPFLEGARKMYTDLILDPNPEERNKYGGTNYLRAGAVNVDRILSFFDKILAETQDDRAIASREHIGQEDLYLDAVKAGKISGSGQKADYPPDTEF